VTDGEEIQQAGEISGVPQVREIIDMSLDLNKDEKLRATALMMAEKNKQTGNLSEVQKAAELVRYARTLHAMYGDSSSEIELMASRRTRSIRASNPDMPT